MFHPMKHNTKSVQSALEVQLNKKCSMILNVTSITASINFWITLYKIQGHLSFHVLIKLQESNSLKKCQICVTVVEERDHSKD